MRELHVVALSEDGRHVVLATRAGTASGEFRVALDERLTAAVRGDLPAPGRDAPPSISPRDIQARLRDGEAPEQIAAAAGVPLSRVERYAGPVLAELERMTTGARAAVVTRPRLGASALPLGEAVEAHLAEVANLAEGSVRWSARRAALGRWVVEVSWTARGRRRTAGWHYDPATREVAAVDGPSAVLGHVEADAVPAAAAARSARPAAPAVRGARTTASGPARPSAAVAPTGRTQGTAAAPTAPGGRTATGAAASAPQPPAARGGATARTQPGARSRSTDARAGSTASTSPATPSPTARRRATASTTAAPAPAPAPARRRPAAPSAVEATSAASTATAATPARRTAARGAAAEQRTARGRAATGGQDVPRRAAARRSAVPSLEGLGAPTAGSTPDAGTTADTAADADTPAASTPDAGAPGTPTASTPGAGAPTPTAATATRPGPTAAGPAPLPSGPPVLRVVPPADPDPASDPDDAAAAPDARPVRRAAGRRAGGRDWADVLMGAAPAAPAAEPRQDERHRP